MKNSRFQQNIPNDRFHQFLTKSQSAVKGCYMLGCVNKPIRAHSITERKLLAKIADKGDVIYPKTDQLLSNLSPTLGRVGISQATTFSGSCGEHDHDIFARIDNADYAAGNIDQEFLFAFRLGAKEYAVRQSMLHLYESLAGSYKNNFIEEDSTDEIVQLGRRFAQGELSLKPYRILAREMEVEREIFNINHSKHRLDKVRTVTVVFEKAYPFVVASLVRPEMTFDGQNINDRPTHRKGPKTFI